MSYSWDHDTAYSAEMVRQLLTKARIPEASRYEPLAQLPDLVPGFATQEDLRNGIDDMGTLVVFAGDGPARDRLKRQSVKVLEDLGWLTLSVNAMAFRARPPKAVFDAARAASEAREEASRLHDEMFRAAGCEPPAPAEPDVCPF